MIDNQVVTKIKKLLELSTSDNPHEAELALTHAKRLAASYDIDLTLIKIFDKTVTDEPIIRANVHLGSRKSIAQKYVSWILQKHFNVKVIYCGNRQRGRFAVLIGKRDKITIAEYVQNFLNREFLSLWHKYYSQTNCGLNFRDSYFLGLFNGLDDKLTKEQKSVEEEKLMAQPEEIKQTFALMVVSDKDKLEKASKQWFPKLKIHKNKFNGNFSDNIFSDGVEAGAKINLRMSLEYQGRANVLA